MNITPVNNNQSFAGRYLYTFDNASKKNRFHNQMKKDIVFVNDHAVLEDPRFNDTLLLLTGQDYEDYKLMSNFIKVKNPVMDKSIYTEELYNTFAKNADVVDLQGEEFVALI